MLYVLLTYLTFLACYEHWATDAVNWQVAYFSVQYLFVAAVAWLHIGKGHGSIVFFGIALIMLSLSINELTWLNSNPKQYSENWNSPPVFTISALSVGLYVFYQLSKRIQWSGPKRLGR